MKELSIRGGTGAVDAIVSLGLSSDYSWEDEDPVEVFRRRYSLSNRC
ncbi:MAG: hypothetical protein QXY40_07680 [Candidatus Methanomethylicia archaeon]